MSDYIQWCRAVYSHVFRCVCYLVASMLRVRFSNLHWLYVSLQSSVESLQRAVKSQNTEAITSQCQLFVTAGDV